MKKIAFRKNKLTLQTIGKKRFYTGVTVGLVSAIIIALFFNYTRELFRYLTGSIADLLILNKQEFLFYNYVSSLLSSVLGLAISIAIWMNNKNHIKRKDKLYKQQAVTNALFIFWLALMVVIRIGHSMSVSLFAFKGYDNELNLYGNYWYLFLLIPIVIYLQSWHTVSRIYRTKKWMLLSFFSCLFISIFISKITSIEGDKINNAYFERYEKDYKYVDKEINNAKINYKIDYSDKTIETLKKHYTRSARKQVISLKKAFSKATKVSLDTIILQKIMIHNYKKSAYYFSGRKLSNWDYALPKDILKQLHFYGVNSNETKELFNVLKEEISLINTPEIEFDDNTNHTETEYNKSYGIRSHTSKKITQQLIIVRDSLIHMKKYSKWSKLLPEIITRH